MLLNKFHTPNVGSLFCNGTTKYVIQLTIYREFLFSLWFKKIRISQVAFYINKHNCLWSVCREYQRRLSENTSRSRVKSYNLLVDTEREMLLLTRPYRNNYGASTGNGPTLSSAGQAHIDAWPPRPARVMGLKAVITCGLLKWNGKKIIIISRVVCLYIVRGEMGPRLIVMAARYKRICGWWMGEPDKWSS